MTDDRAPNLDPETLRTFIAVAQLRSFSAAAEQLHKTTSAISYRIKALEDSIGVALLQRTTRTVALTPAGSILLGRASQMFEWLQTLPRELAQVNQGVEPRIVLVLNNLLYDSDAAATLLAHLHTQFPFTNFELRCAVYMGVWDELMHNGAQVAIGAPGFHTINDDFATRPLGVVNWHFVMAPGHPLAREREPLGNEVLRRHPAINIEDTSRRLSKRTAWRVAGQQELRVPDLRTKEACHVMGLGVGFLPAARARAAVRAGTLVERAVASGRSPSPLALAWRRQDAGKVTAHLCELFTSGSALVAPFLSVLDLLEPRAPAERLAPDAYDAAEAPLRNAG